ncbi:hypothetical protein AB0L20_32125, partial [Streptomyces albidoflavus]|uniref:hypothetical protein n=1 Tax=Streptomyces albidoflavus TaxID=1886 RepID=UPI003441700B
PTGKFYTRYASAAAGIRAFSIGYDKTLAAKIDPIVVAIANSFTPFPTGPMPIAAAPTPAMPAAGKPPSPITASNVLGTGLAVAKRQIVTGADVGTCKDPRAGGVKPLRIGGTGPWLWDFADDLKAPSARLASRDMMEGSQLLVVGFSVESAPARLDATPGVTIDGTAISAPLQPGASGAPVFDQSGAFVGLVGTVAADGRRIAGIMPTTRYALVAPEKVNAVAANIIGRQSISAAPMRAAEIVNAIKPSLVPIQCGP